MAHDEIVNTPEGIRWVSGRASGTEGGLSTVAETRRNVQSYLDHLAIR